LVIERTYLPDCWTFFAGELMTVKRCSWPWRTESDSHQRCESLCQQYWMNIRNYSTANMFIIKHRGLCVILPSFNLKTHVCLKQNIFKAKIRVFFYAVA